MTYEEAIERIKKLHCWGIGTECEYHTDKRGKCSNCEIGMAIEAIEKQIPKKPIEKIVVTQLDSLIPYKTPSCPRCEKTHLWSWEKFFNGCGQAIDWSEEE